MATAMKGERKMAGKARRAPVAKRSVPAKRTSKKAAPRAKKHRLVIDRAENGRFESGGLRDQFVYRHFGIEEATGRKYSAHVIRAAGGKPSIRHHVHPDCEFLLVYVLKGWIKFWYEGRGEEKLVAGDVHLLPAGIKHAVTGWSKNLEMLEVTHPADYRSIELTDRQIAALG